MLIRVVYSSKISYVPRRARNSTASRFLADTFVDVEEVDGSTAPAAFHLTPSSYEATLADNPHLRKPSHDVALWRGRLFWPLFDNFATPVAAKYWAGELGKDCGAHIASITSHQTIPDVLQVSGNADVVTWPKQRFGDVIGARNVVEESADQDRGRISRASSHVILRDGIVFVERGEPIWTLINGAAADVGARMTVSPADRAFATRRVPFLDCEMFPSGRHREAEVRRQQMLIANLARYVTPIEANYWAGELGKDCDAHVISYHGYHDCIATDAVLDDFGIYRSHVDVLTPMLRALMYAITSVVISEIETLRRSSHADSDPQPSIDELLASANTPHWLPPLASTVANCPKDASATTMADCLSVMLDAFDALDRRSMLTGTLSDYARCQNLVGAARRALDRYASDAASGFLPALAVTPTTHEEDAALAAFT